MSNQTHESEVKAIKKTEVSNYVLLKMSSSFCPKCQSTVELLSRKDGGLPNFFICFKCGRVAQVGVAEVKREI